jgi:hypothetical protein
MSKRELVYAYTKIDGKIRHFLPKRGAAEIRSTALIEAELADEIEFQRRQIELATVDFRIWQSKILH